MKRLLKNHNFLLLLLGQSVSSAGTWINFVGLNAYVYHMSGSGRLLGLFLLVRLLPALFFGSLGGILADRFNRRKILIMCDLIRGFLVLAFLVTNNIYLYFIIGFFLSALDKIFTASMGAILPDIVAREDLLEANSLKRMSQSLITVMGPAIGGALIGLYGYKAVFMVDSGTFFFSVLTLLLITHIVETGKKEGYPAGIKEELRITLSFIMGSTLFFSMMILRVLDGLGSGTYNTALPVFAADITRGGGSFYAYLIASWGFGTFLGSLCVSFLQKRFRIESLFCAAMLLMAAGMGGTFNTNHLSLSLVSIFIGGFGDGISSVIFTTMLMETPPKELRGKVFGSVSALLYMSAGFGMLFGGIFLDYFKYFQITNAGSLFIILCTVITWVMIKRRSEDSISS